MLITLQFSSCYFHPASQAVFNSNKEESTSLSSFFGFLFLSNSSATSEVVATHIITGTLAEGGVVSSNFTLRVDSASGSTRNANRPTVETKTDSEGRFTLYLTVGKRTIRVFDALGQERGTFTIEITPNGREPIVIIVSGTSIGLQNITMSSPTNAFPVSNPISVTQGGTTTATTTGTTTASTANSNNLSPTLRFPQASYDFSNNSSSLTITPIIEGNNLTRCLVSPPLPNGLFINDSNCAIGGTPVANQTSTSYMITAFNSFGLSSASINIAVTAGGLYQWTKLGASGSGSAANGITTDSNGNVYITGYTNGNLDGESITGSQDMFITKYNNVGIRIWTRLLGSSSVGTVSHGIVTDGSGNVYATGYTQGDLDTEVKTGSIDLFLVKYNSTGTRLWTRLLGVAPANTLVSYAIANDTTGNLYLTGTTTGGLDGETLVGSQDLFLVKYDSNGNKLWTRQFGASGADTLPKGLVFKNGNVYIAGYVSGTIWDGQAIAGTSDIFLINFSENGVKGWSKTLGVSGGSCVTYAITSDSLSNLYITGLTTGNLDSLTKSGSVDAFVIKYNSSGTKQWTKLLGATSSTTDGRAIAIDSSSNLYITGLFSGGSSLAGETKTGNLDAFISKFSSNGDKKWTRLFGVAGLNTQAFGITLDASGNLFSTGNTDGNLGGETLSGSNSYFLVRYH